MDNLMLRDMGSILTIGKRSICFLPDLHPGLNSLFYAAGYSLFSDRGNIWIAYWYIMLFKPVLKILVDIMSIVQ